MRHCNGQRVFLVPRLPKACIRSAAPAAGRVSENSRRAEVIRMVVVKDGRIGLCLNVGVRVASTSPAISQTERACCQNGRAWNVARED